MPRLLGCYISYHGTLCSLLHLSFWDSIRVFIKIIYNVNDFFIKCSKQYLNISNLDAVVVFCHKCDILDVLDDVGIVYKHGGFHRIHQIQLLCDYQELAYTPKDPR